MNFYYYHRIFIYKNIFKIFFYAWLSYDCNSCKSLTLHLSCDIHNFDNTNLALRITPSYDVLHDFHQLLSLSASYLTC